jgi:hypothetical protein
MSTTLRVVRIEAEDWKANFSEVAHLLAFSRNKPVAFDRIDYALLVLQGDKPAAYVTAREQDHETVYWQFGGGFPWALRSILMTRIFDIVIGFEKLAGRKRLSIRIENTNLAMLKLAISRSWLVVGVLSIDGNTLVQLVKNINGESGLRDAL